MAPIVSRGLRRHQPRAGVASLLVLFALLLAATAAVTSALHGPDWASLWGGLLLGLLAGWGLVVLGQPAGRSLIACGLTGITYAVISGGGLAPRCLDAGLALGRLGWEISGWAADSAQAMQAEIVALQALASAAGVVMIRTHAWVIALASGMAVFDPVPASIVWRGVVWGMAGWAGWAIEARRQALTAALPAMLIGGGALSYAGRQSFSMLLMLAACLLLIALLAQEKRRLRWEAAGVAYPASKGRGIVSVAAAATLGLVAAGAVAPTFSISRLSDWLESRQRPSAPAQPALVRSLGIVPANSGPGAVLNAARQPGLPRELLIGSGPELSQKLVMTVSVQIPGGAAPGLYWRSYTYDDYTGRGWASSATEQRTLAAGQPLSVPLAADQVLLEQTIRPVNGGDGTLYAAGQPVRIDHPSEVAVRPPDDLFGVQTDQTPRYTVWSLRPTTEPEALRAAGIHYPDWIRARYLSLPSSVPERVKALAINLTAGEPTPYDRAEAIESYLRDIPYSLDVPRPPLGRDVVDFFLYDLRMGYCDYYASAMVVLARAAGIPARLAIGYAEGSYDLNTHLYRLTEADAHSWVEVYFPDIGWVPFEPTAARPRLEANQPMPPALPPQPAPPPALPSPFPPARPSAGGMLLASLAMAAGIAAAWAGWDAMRLARLPERRAAAEIYRRLRKMGRRMGVRVERGVTPHEFGQAFTLRLRRLTGAEGWRWETAAEIEAMVEDVALAQFRPAAGSDRAKDSLRSRWRALHWRLLRQWLAERMLASTRHGRKGVG
jgi:transglutaminase-like putative cysteine protease